MRIVARVACCAYIIFYVVVPMLRTPAGEDSMNPRLKLGFAIGFIVIVAAIVIATTREVITNWKAGYFKADAYDDDPGIAGADEDEEETGVEDETGEEDETEDEDEE